jgi:hypothetical protein
MGLLGHRVRQFLWSNIFCILSALKGKKIFGILSRYKKETITPKNKELMAPNFDIS